MAVCPGPLQILMTHPLSTEAGGHVYARIGSQYSHEPEKVV